MNNILLILLVLVIAYYYFSNNKETFLELTNEQQSFVDKLYNYINENDLTFELYVGYLSSVNNPYLNLVDENVFNDFKKAKADKWFTKQQVIAKMI